MPTTPEFAKEVGVAFIRAYYGMSSPPSELAHMYSKDSVFCRTYKDQTSEDVSLCGGGDIKSFLTSQPQAKYQLTYVECSPTAADSILILVEGTFCTEYRSSSFYQSFVLAPNSRADQSCYYIHNDSMRLWDDEPAEAVKPTEEYHEPQPPAPQEPIDEPVQEAEIESMVENVMNVVEPEQEVVQEPTLVHTQPEADMTPHQLEEPEAPAQAADLEDGDDAAAEQEIAEEAAQEPEHANGVEDAAAEEDNEEDVINTAGMSYAQILAAKRQQGAKAGKIQVVSGGAVPMAPKKTVADPEKKKRADKDLSALSLIRQNGKGEGGKGGKNANGKGSKGFKGEKGEKGAAAPFSLYVTKLPKTFSDDDCESVFGAFGKIAGKTIRANEGFAFIDFESKAAMQKALAQ
eukprot:gene17348-26649_t